MRKVELKFWTKKIDRFRLLGHTNIPWTSSQSERPEDVWTPFSGFPIGFFNTVIPIQNFVQSRNPQGYFWHSASQAYFKPRNSPRFCFQIPNPELQIREIPDPEKPIVDPPGVLSYPSLGSERTWERGWQSPKLDFFLIFTSSGSHLR